MTDAQPNLASELIYQTVREKVNVCAIAVFAGDLVRAQLALGKDPTDAADMIAKAWDRVTSDLEALIIDMICGTTEAETSDD